MPDIVVTIGNMTKTKKLTAGEVTRLLAALKTHYGQITERPENGPPVTRDRTNAELFDAVATGFMRGLVDIVKRVEQDKAAETAHAGVTEVNLTD